VGPPVSGSNVTVGVYGKTPGVKRARLSRLVAARFSPQIDMPPSPPPPNPLPPSSIHCRRAPPPNPLSPPPPSPLPPSSIPRRRAPPPNPLPPPLPSIRRRLPRSVAIAVASRLSNNKVSLSPAFLSSCSYHSSSPLRDGLQPAAAQSTASLARRPGADRSPTTAGTASPAHRPGADQAQARLQRSLVQKLDQGPFPGSPPIACLSMIACCVCSCQYASIVCTSLHCCNRCHGNR
jgi:hypothetical protein